MEKTCNPCAACNGDDGDAEAYFRVTPPAHYTLKIESFSDLVEMLTEVGSKYYESPIFAASGYKWKLILYPNGDERRNGNGHISMYLRIEETEALPPGWQVNVNFRLFVFDQIHDKFLTVQDPLGTVRRLHPMKRELGFAQLLPQSAFRDAKNGYLIDDNCGFGAEIFVISQPAAGDCVTCLKNFDGRYTWEIHHFYSLSDMTHCSDIFTVGGLKWKLSLYPKGDREGAGKSLSLFLSLEDLTARVYAECLLCIRNQQNSKHTESTVRNWFTPSTRAWGFSHFLSLSDTEDASKGFVMNGTMIVEVNIKRLFLAKILS